MKSFLHRIVTGDVKWIHYDNPKRKKVWVCPGEVAPTKQKSNIYGSKLMLSIWWDHKGAIFYDVLNLLETITADRY